MKPPISSPEPLLTESGVEQTTPTRSSSLAEILADMHVKWEHRVPKNIAPKEERKT